MTQTHQLIIRENKGEPWFYNLGNNQVKIGRSRSCELRIPDSRISREHCVIRKFNNKYFISDLESRNGFSVNGIPEKEKELLPNDRITIGFTSLNYIVQEAQENDILITQDEPNETFSFTLELDSKNDETFFSNRGALDTFQNILHIINEEEELKPLADKIISVIKNNTPANDCAIAIYDINDLTLISEYKDPTLKLKIAKKTLTKVIESNEAFYTHNDEESDEQSTLLLPLFCNDKIACILILLTKEELQKSSDIRNLFTIISKLISVAFKKQLKMESLSKELSDNLRLQSEFNFIGDSEPMKKVYNMIRRVGPVDVTVLITGESGTGKELVAKAIHQTSTRKNAPFVSINCGAIPVSLIESELFGHEKGAFTGAVKSHPGCFEQANNGILFLDEIGELDPNVQVKLLRALETRTIRRVGGEKDIPINIRVVTATHRNLEKMVEEQKFREDLYFRLQVIEIHLPTLANRGNDIKLIAEYFAHKICNEMGRPSPKISEEAYEVLLNYSWPGNVRELKNAIERAIVLSPEASIEASSFEHLKSKKSTNTEKATIETDTTSSSNIPTLKELEKDHIMKVLELVSGNKRKAAEILGVERKTLYNKLSAYEIDGSNEE